MSSRDDDLFSAEPGEHERGVEDRLRPQSLEEFVGQRRLIESDRHRQCVTGFDVLSIRCQGDQSRRCGGCRYRYAVCHRRLNSVSYEQVDDVVAGDVRVRVEPGDEEPGRNT